MNLDSKQTYDFATQLLQKYIIPSLENDVNLCLSVIDPKTTSTNAYIPALLYCFSIIDVLGALLEGHARKGNTTQNMEKYMIKYMNYSSSDVKFILQVFRHKIVHLAIPKPIIENNGKYLSWNLHEQDHSKHKTRDGSPGDLDIFGYRKDHYDEKFLINIRQFKEDIIKSITSNTGYLATLKTDPQLQKNFVVAINHIYDPHIKD